MPLLEDVVKMGKKLENMMSSDTVDQAQAFDILKCLKQMPMSLEVFQKARIGMIVNNFSKKCTEDQVVTLAKSLTKSWGKLIPESGRSQSSQSSASHNSSQEKDEEKKDDENDADDEEEDKPSAPVRRASLPENVDTNDSIRLRCRELITAALKTKPYPEEGEEPEHCAVAIEAFIYKDFQNTGKKYKIRVRSRVANLKDSRNPKLRENVLIGLISAENIAKMTAEEMASDEMKKLREKLTQESINDHLMVVNHGTETDLFMCGRCGERQCTYTQLQTRSADEPMTTFVVCLNCGNRWKFC